MNYIHRKIAQEILRALERSKSVLLLGARQTGKTTLIHHQIKPTLSYSFIQPENRRRYEQNPSLLAQEIEAEVILKQLDYPIICIDEVQKVPFMMDVIQDLIDRKIARFVLTGSSAHKLKYGANINLLPGRVVLHHLYPLTFPEMISNLPPIEQLLLYGSLPGILNTTELHDKELDLKAYVNTYLEEEIRTEALVRNIATFSKFLFLAASESGNIINLTQLSQAIGVAHTTIASYYQILEDCLIAEKIEAISESSIRRRLSHAPKYLFFDLGVRRLSAGEGYQLPIAILSRLFEQFIGLELIHQANNLTLPFRLRYWRSHDGPEVDFVLQMNQQYIPIEVKWTETPMNKDARHLKLFMNEYQNTEKGYIICRTPKPLLLQKNIIALPWQDVHKIFEMMQ